MLKNSIILNQPAAKTIIDPTQDATPPKLTIELVPQTCWNINVRNMIPKQWPKIREQQFKKANRHCEICGEQGLNHAVECNEVWEYDDENKIQKLAGLMALCPSCHQVKHFGLSRLNGLEQKATLRLEKINGWSKEQTDKYIKSAFEKYNERSQFSWELDLSWLEQTQNIFIDEEYLNDFLDTNFSTERKHSLIADIKTKTITQDCQLKPAEILQTEAHWLWAENNKYADIPITQNKIGKWMLYYPRNAIDSKWEQVKQAIANGDLWHAKVSTKTAKISHVIIIYTKDYTDKQDVIAVLDYLESSGLKPKRTIFYKTDEQTYAGIYAGGEQQPWIYRSNTIRSNITDEPKKKKKKPAVPLPPIFGLLDAGGSTEQITTMLQNNVDTTSKDWHKENILLHAVKLGSLEYVQLFCETPKTTGLINAKNRRHETSLLRAFQLDKIEIVTYLLTKKADLNVWTSDKRNPLHFAILVKNLTLIEKIVETASKKQLDFFISQKDKFGRTPLEYIFISRKKSEGFANPGHLVEHYSDEHEKMYKYFSKYFDKNFLCSTDKYLKTIIHNAAAFFPSDLLKELIEISGKEIVNAVDQYGKTPLHEAAIGGNLAVFKLLLELGAIDHKSNEDQTAKDIIMCIYGSETVDFLLTNSSDKNTMDNFKSNNNNNNNSTSNSYSFWEHPRPVQSASPPKKISLKRPKSPTQFAAGKMPDDDLNSNTSVDNNEQLNNSSTFDSPLNHFKKHKSF